MLDGSFGNRGEWRASRRLCGRRTIGVGLRHQICRDAVRSLSALLHADIIGGLWRNRILLRQAVIRPRVPVYVDDSLGQNVRNRLPSTLRLIDAKRVVEAAVLAEYRERDIVLATPIRSQRAA